MKNTHILILSFIIASRFFSLFIVLPVISLYAQRFSAASPLALGLIVGIYAVFQMLFSLPFGALSDFIGRRASMLIGLVIFIAGSLICAQAASLEALLFGRALQGMGAIGGVATAMIADLSSEKSRAKAMAIMGGCIGMSFAAAMIIGPALAHFAQISALFYLSAALSALAILLLAALPSVRPQRSERPHSSELKRIFNANLNLLYLTNFLQKALVAGVFTLLPIIYLRFGAGFELYKLYGCAMALGFLAMGFAGVMGEKRGKSKMILLAGVALFGASCLAFSCGELGAFYAGVGLFFLALCLHEPIMQSSLSKICPARLKGSALGFSNACGYLGSFAAPLLSAWALSNDAVAMLCAAAATLCALWFALLLRLENPNDFKLIHLGFGVDCSRLPAIDRGCDERGNWVKINLVRFPVEKICEQLGISVSGASPAQSKATSRQNLTEI